MIATYATFVDFSTPDDWTLSGEAEVGNGSLTMTQPWHNAYWNANNWSVTPPFSNNGNDHAILLDGQVYTHSLGGVAREMQDFQVDLTIDWALAPGVGVWFNVRRDEVAVGGGSWQAMLGYKSTTYKQWLFDTANLKVLADSGAWLSETAWYDYALQSYGSTWNIKIGGKTHWKGRGMTALGASYLRLHGSGCAGTQFLCGAGVNDREWPIVSTHAIGAAELKEASGWVTPADVGDILRVVPYVNRLGVGSFLEQFCDVAFQYKYGGGAWTDLPNDGDVSGISAAADTKLLVRVDDGAGTGMDNYRDMRLVPEIFGFDIIHTQTTETGGGGGHIERRNIGMIGGRE